VEKENRKHVCKSAEKQFWFTVRDKNIACEAKSKENTLNGESTTANLGETYFEGR
jgi:hypothetical protein